MHKTAMHVETLCGNFCISEGPSMQNAWSRRSQPFAEQKKQFSACFPHLAFFSPSAVSFSGSFPFPLSPLDFRFCVTCPLMSIGFSIFDSR